MAINIKNREVEELLGELRQETGQGTTEIVLQLVRQEVARRHRLREIADRRRKAEALVARYRARLPKSPLAAEEIVGYDEHGLPR
jgi:antitoxin VapB